MNFRKQIRLSRNSRVNLSKSGISFSFGIPGLSVNFGKKGIFLNAGIPGSGIFTRKKIGGKNGK